MNEKRNCPMCGLELSEEIRLEQYEAFKAGWLVGAANKMPPGGVSMRYANWYDEGMKAGDEAFREAVRSCAVGLDLVDEKNRRKRTTVIVEQVQCDPATGKPLKPTTNSEKKSLQPEGENDGKS